MRCRKSQCAEQFRQNCTDSFVTDIMENNRVQMQKKKVQFAMLKAMHAMIIPNKNESHFRTVIVPGCRNNRCNRPLDPGKRISRFSRSSTFILSALLKTGSTALTKTGALDFFFRLLPPLNKSNTRRNMPAYKCIGSIIGRISQGII